MADDAAHEAESSLAQGWLAVFHKQAGEYESRGARAAEIRKLAASSHLGNEFTRPFLGGAYSPGPLPDTNDDTNPCTERKVAAGGGSPDDMPSMSTPDIERGVRLVCWASFILFSILVVIPLIAAILERKP